jgi:hypothetical protein
MDIFFDNWKMSNDDGGPLIGLVLSIRDGE